MVKTLPHIVVEFGPTKVDYLACCVCASFIKHLIKLENRLSFIEGIFQYILDYFRVLGRLVSIKKLQYAPIGYQTPLKSIY